jgi:predicted transcriptional regulator
MKYLDVNQFDERDEEIADALISLGMSRNAARMLVHLQNVDEASSRELEKGTGLHQPEVSIAAKDLKESGWINMREVPKTGKGRPYKMFSLKISFNNIIDQLEKQQEKAVDEVRSRIELLKNNVKILNHN